MAEEEGKLLGKQVDYPKSYCPEILVAVSRSLNREIYDIFNPEELFCGFDCWHAYEAGFLLDNGMPVTGVLKIVYPAESSRIVESKSLKLYLGSFSMIALGSTLKEATENYILRIKNDLKQLLATKVDAHFFYIEPAKISFDFNEYRILEHEISPEEINFSIYNEHSEYLSENVQSKNEIKWGTHLLKSNCKITNQPDWGSVYIRMKGGKIPDKKSILKYIVSLRDENHFHEEICEMIYKRLSDLFSPAILMVCCLYTRRGGIDICPVRANHPAYLPELLGKSDYLTQRTFRQ